MTLREIPQSEWAKYNFNPNEFAAQLEGGNDVLSNFANDPATLLVQKANENVSSPNPREDSGNFWDTLTDFWVGMGQGATVGLAPKLSGLAATAMQEVGLGEKAYGSDDASFWARNKVNTDIAKEVYQESRERSPVASLAGDLVGGLATPGLGSIAGVAKGTTTAAKLAHLGKVSGLNALQGGIAGAGYSDKDLKDITMGDVLPGMVLGAAVPVGAAAAKQLPKAASFVSGKLGGVRGELADFYKTNVRKIDSLDGTSVLENAKNSLESTQANIANRVEQTANNIIDTRSTLQKQISQASSEAYKTLDSTKEVSISWIPKEIDRILNKNSVRGVQTTLGDKKAYSAMNDLRERIVEIIKKTPNLNGKISELEVKPLLQAMDEVAYSNPIKSAFTSHEIRGMREIRGMLDNSLKKNLSYKKAMEKTSRLTEFAKNFDKRIKVDNDASLLKSLQTLSTNPKFKEKLESLARTTGNKQLEASLSDLSVKQNLLKRVRPMMSSAEANKRGLEKVIRDITPYELKQKGGVMSVIDDVVWGTNKDVINRAQTQNQKARDVISAYEQLTGKSLLQDAEMMSALHMLNTGRANGSRNTNWMRSLGKLIGSVPIVKQTLDAMGDGLSQDILGAVGATAGMLRDSGGPRIFRLLEDVMDRGRQISELPVIQKTVTPVLQNAIKLPAQEVERQKQINRDYFGRD